MNATILTPLPLTAKEVASFKVSQLKDECRARGLKTSGVKQELVERLKAQLRKECKIRRNNPNCNAGIPKCSAGMDEELGKKKNEAATCHSRSPPEWLRSLPTASRRRCSSPLNDAKTHLCKDHAGTSVDAVQSRTDENAVASAPICNSMQADLARQARAPPLQDDVETLTQVGSANEVHITMERAELDTTPIPTMEEPDAESTVEGLDLGGEAAHMSVDENTINSIADSVEVLARDIKGDDNTVDSTSMGDSTEADYEPQTQLSQQNNESDIASEVPSTCKMLITNEAMEASTSVTDQRLADDVAAASTPPPAQTPTGQEHSIQSSADASHSSRRSTEGGLRLKSPSNLQQQPQAEDEILHTPSKFAGILERLHAKERGEDVGSGWTPRQSPMRSKIWQTPPRGAVASSVIPCLSPVQGHSATMQPIATSLVMPKTEVDSNRPLAVEHPTRAPSASPATTPKKPSVWDEKRRLLAELTDKMQDCLRKIQDRSLDEKSVEKYQVLAQAIRKQIDNISGPAPERSLGSLRSPGFVRSPAFIRSPVGPSAPSW